METAMRENPLEGCFRVEQFADRNRDLVSMNQLRWQLRNRHQNGLVAAGAVLEIRSRPDQRRPLLIIEEERYFAWLQEQGKWLRRACTYQGAAA
jgi:hypothetical protein